MTWTAFSLHLSSLVLGDCTCANTKQFLVPAMCSLLFSFFEDLFLFCVRVCVMCVCVCVGGVFLEARRGHGIPWSSLTWVLATELSSSCRAFMLFMRSGFRGAQTVRNLPRSLGCSSGCTTPDLCGGQPGTSFLSCACQACPLPAEVQPQP